MLFVSMIYIYRVDNSAFRMKNNTIVLDECDKRGSDRWNCGNLDHYVVLTTRLVETLS